MEGRATDKVDLRVYKIDPLSRNFWPFPANPVELNENARPPMPGEEPEYGTQLSRQLQLLGSPPVSELAALPISKGSAQSSFGLDLSPYFERISGAKKPGTYLVGYRLLDSSIKRYYVRLSVTDLSLSTVEEEHAVQFVVTSLATGAPVEGASVRIDADFNGEWKPVVSGVTDVTGQFRYEHKNAIREALRRIVVSYGDDVLVLNPAEPPPHFMNNHWYGNSSRWLSWLNSEPRTELEQPKLGGFILSERPIYRPDEPVHLLGYVRERRQGKIIRPSDEGRKYSVYIRGPGREEWNLPVTLESLGRFSFDFDERDASSGTYLAVLRELASGRELARVSFKKEAYRIPRFEIQLSGPESVPLDRKFDLVLTADYYAGGRVVGQKVSWEITQYRYQVRPPSYQGFIFSTDEQFSDGRQFRARGASRSQDLTDDTGSATLTLNPAIEEDGLPRRYVVQATVLGADRQTVTATKEIVALPAFMLGLKVGAFVTEGKTVKPEIVVLDPDRKALAGKEITVRLYQRQWHSYLSESDFTTGEAKYVSDVVDELLLEKQTVSIDGTLKLDFPVKESGVYIVEALGRDHLGRLQRVQKDLYVAGDDVVAWEKPEGSVFQTTLDKADYVEGDTASILLKSPYQDARALVIVEGPAGNAYHWIDVRGGQGLFSFKITNDMHPSLPVHVLLLRGRVEGTGTTFRPGEDRGKPAAMATTVWVPVEPAENRALLELEHEKKVLPGSTLHVKLSLTDIHGNALDGEAALWLVDRAVLSLAPEQFTDPLLSFIEPAKTNIRIRETRNEVVGNLPLRVMPGGGGEAMREAALFAERVSVRKNFQTVPYYNASIPVKNGIAEIDIPMPDNLTEFAVRAIGISGYDKFAVAKSSVLATLPVIVQSALPRFVRPSDSFVAGGIGRVVEGDGGPAEAAVSSEGMTINGKASAYRSFTLDGKRPERLLFPFTVPESGGAEEVTVEMRVKRTADGAADAFRLELPLKLDLEKRSVTAFAELSGNVEAAFPGPDEPAQPGTLSRKLFVTREPAIAKIVAGLRFLSAYEYGCTEQQVSRFYPSVALERLYENGMLPSWYRESGGDFASLFTYLESALGEDGLYSYWPGSTGYVYLTAYVVEFLADAKAAGVNVPDALIERPKKALVEALRSDYRKFIRDYSLRERIEAALALSRLNSLDAGYAQDLLADAYGADLYSKSRILSLFLKQGKADQSAVQRLLEDVRKRVVLRLQGEEEVFAGLDETRVRLSGPILSSETGTLAAVLEALYRAEPDGKKTLILLDELVRRGNGNGWGSTFANVQAIRALELILGSSGKSGTDARFDVIRDGKSTPLAFGERNGIPYTFEGDSPASLRVSGNAAGTEYLALMLCEIHHGDAVGRSTREKRRLRDRT